MNSRALVTVIVAIVISNTAIALALWWLMAPPLGLATERTVTAPSAVQRLAEAHAHAAAASVVATDLAALDQLLRPATRWPEVVYVSIENTQGKILAHTDAARTGRVWNARMGAEIRATVKVPYEEVVAAVGDPSRGGDSDARVGLVRLGYTVDAVTRAVRETSATSPRLWLVLGVAVLAALPVGALVVRATATSRPDDGDPFPTRLAARDETGLHEEIVAARTEIERLKSKLEERGRRLEARSRELDEQVLALADARIALERLTAEAAELRQTIAAQSSELHALREENADWQVVVRRLRADVPVHSTDEHVTTEAPPDAGGPTDRWHGKPDASLRTRHAPRHTLTGAILYIAHVFRTSLTPILGFSKLLLRRADGSLTEAQADSVASIHDAGLRLLSFVTALVDYERVVTTTHEPQPDTLDLATLLGDAISELKRSRSPVAVKLNLPPHPISVWADRSDLQRIVCALVQQAEWAPGRAEVVLTVKVGVETVQLEVEVPGHTAPPQPASPPVDPFPWDNERPGRPDGSRAHLALATVLATTSALDLRVDAHHGTGARFTLTIPAVAVA